ncbi:MAG: LysM peptidoglycan-binding domain-containing protein [bacterium]|nr:LysM peptidoglycan-binding domain-containing protein [bacterium]
MRKDMTIRYLDMVKLPLMIAVLLTIGAFLITPIVKASGVNTVTREQQVKSIQIQEGDSLWSIAKENFSSEYDSIDQYVKDIKECNNISSDTIHAGKYLIIPYYN